MLNFKSLLMVASLIAVSVLSGCSGRAYPGTIVFLNSSGIDLDEVRVESGDWRRSVGILGNGDFKVYYDEPGTLPGDGVVSYRRDGKVVRVKSDLGNAFSGKIRGDVVIEILPSNRVKVLSDTNHDYMKRAHE